jgi:hypothetical protein
VGPIATEYGTITSKLICGNMWGLLPQMEIWWQYCVLLQRNMVVAINFVAIDGNPCSGTPKLWAIAHENGPKTQT